MKSTSITMILSNFLLVLALSSVILEGSRTSVAAEDPLEDPLALSLLSDDLELPIPSARIVNGDKSEPSSRSFFAKAGYDQYTFTSEILCGATLINSDIAITAA